MNTKNGWLGGGFFNHFDGSVDLLDDLDDHYTARTHKKERNWMIEKFQDVCRQCMLSSFRTANWLMLV